MDIEYSEISEVRTGQEAEELVSLFQVVFGAGDTSLWESFHSKEPFYLREWSRVIKCQERIVSHVCWVPRQIRVGCALIRAGMIGYTATHPDHRGQGLAAKLMNSWTEELSLKGYPLSIVTAIPGFYEQFGYTFAFPSDDRDPAIVLDLEDSKDLQVPPKHCLFSKQDLPLLEHLYQSENSCRTGALVRNHEYWLWLIEGLERSGRLSENDIWLVKDRHEQAVAYMFLRPGTEGRYELLEASAADDATANDVLEVAIFKALSAKASCIELKLPLDHKVSRLALQRGAGLTGYSFGSHARILNLGELFAVLQPELEKRVRATTWGSWQGTLHLRTDVGDINIGLNKGKVAVDTRVGNTLTVDLPQWLLVKLVTGYTNVPGISGLGRADVDPAARPLLRVLFPKGCPYLWNVDVGY